MREGVEWFTLKFNCRNHQKYEIDKAIGIFCMTDDSELDETIIAIPFKDPQKKQWQDISDLPRHIYF